jgi:hypothetical protein
MTGNFNVFYGKGEEWRFLWSNAIAIEKINGSASVYCFSKMA